VVRERKDDVVGTTGERWVGRAARRAPRRAAILLGALLGLVVLAAVVANVVAGLPGRWFGSRPLPITITVGVNPAGVAVDPTTHRAYVANSSDGTVSVLDGGA